MGLNVVVLCRQVTWLTQVAWPILAVGLDLVFPRRQVTWLAQVAWPI